MSRETLPAIQETRWTLVSPPGLPDDAPAANTVSIDGRTFRSDNIIGSALPVAFTVALVRTRARSRKEVA